MEFTKYIRCPKCDGKIGIPKEIKEPPFWGGERILIPQQRIPTCSRCFTKYQVSIKTEELMEIKLTEY